jgi:hyperosmotically inducible periplasmic protein
MEEWMPTTNSTRQALRWIAAAAAALCAAPALASPPEDSYSIGYPNEEALQSESPKRSFGETISDAWITSQVKMRLIRKPGIAPLAMNVDTENGIVTLFGTISTEDGKREAGLQAMKISGVKDVQNELQVVSEFAEEQVEQRDEAILETVRTEIDERPALENDDIDVDVADGVVRLTGSVDQAGDRVVAQALARSTAGVRLVVDDLRVEQG